MKTFIKYFFVTASGIAGVVAGYFGSTVKGHTETGGLSGSMSYPFIETAHADVASDSGTSDSGCGSSGGCSGGCGSDGA